jgi:hypothetical protein
MPQLSDMLALASAYQGCIESSAVYKTFVQHLGAVMGAQAVQLWTRDHGGEGLTCANSWFHPGTPFHASSALNLDHVLTTVVHQAATVVPFDLCAIGIFDRNQFVLGRCRENPRFPRLPRWNNCAKSWSGSRLRKAPSQRTATRKVG